MEIKTVQTTSKSLAFKGVNMGKGINAGRKIVKKLPLADTFERAKLPNNIGAGKLNGPYGHPHTGRALLNDSVPSSPDEIFQVVKNGEFFKNFPDANFPDPEILATMHLDPSILAEHGLQYTEHGVQFLEHGGVLHSIGKAIWDIFT